MLSKKLFLSMTSCWLVNFILRMMISFIRHVYVKHNIRVTYTFKYIIYPRSPSISIYHTQNFKREIRYTTFLILNYWSQSKCIIWIFVALRKNPQNGRIFSQNENNLYQSWKRRQIKIIVIDIRWNMIDCFSYEYHNTLMLSVWNWIS